MKKQYSSPLIILLLAVLSLFLSCKKDFRIALENSIRRYTGGDKKAFAEIEENFINAVSILAIKNEKKHILSRIILKHDKDSYKAVYPFNFQVSKTNLKIRIADYNNEIAVFSDGKRILISDKNGKIVKIINPGNKNSFIKDVIVNEQRIIYFSQEELRYYNYQSGKSGLITDDKLSPPYNKYYTVHMKSAGRENISVVAGAGGSYYLYVLNSTTGRILLNKYSVSTPKLLYLDESLYLVKGSAGKWHLVRISLNNSREELLDSFSNISDLELIPEGYLYHIEDTLWFKDFNGNKTRIPFKYRISGIINKHPVLQFNNSLFLINWEKMNGKLMHLKMIIPGLFELEKKLKTEK